MINIGCGKTYHPDWINIDLFSKCSGVIDHDLRMGLPFESRTFDVCYSSHVLEHLRKEEAINFIQEQRRILRAGGILRVVVPDTEIICRNYLKYLEQLVSGDHSAEFRYDYSLLELFDQTVRERTGGELAKILESTRLSESDLCFLGERQGQAGSYLTANFVRKTEQTAKKKKRTLIHYLSHLKKKVNYKAAEFIFKIFFGKKSVQAFREGMFRNTGEIHRVMYDRYSLQRLLGSNGFVDIQVCNAVNSRIPSFEIYELDSFSGKSRKPDSLYMEACAPGR
jgi:predicted SAM-dependent methyltransferase